MNWRRPSWTLSLVMGLFLAMTACETGEEQSNGSGEGSGGETLVIGMAADLSGPLSAIEVPAREGLEVAVDEINANGGIAGKYPVELMVKDMKGDATQGVTLVQELLDAGAEVIIPSCESVALVPGAQVAAQENKLIISTCATTPSALEAVGENFFFVAFGDNGQAAAAAEYAVTELNAETAYVLGSSENDYTRLLSEYFIEAFEHLGGEIVGEDTLTFGQSDYSAQVSRVAALQPPPDVIYTSMYVPDGTVLWKQLRGAGVALPVITADANDTPLFIDSIGAAAENSYITTHGYPEEGSSLADFYALYEEKTGNAPETVFTALGWDTMKVIEAAVEKADSVEGADLVGAMQDLSGVEGATGTISYEPGTRTPIKPVTIMGVTDNRFQFVTTFSPEFVPPP